MSSEKYLKERCLNKPSLSYKIVSENKKNDENILIKSNIEELSNKENVNNSFNENSICNYRIIKSDSSKESTSDCNECVTIKSNYKVILIKLYRKIKEIIEVTDERNILKDTNQ
jgi:hypothetical protein